MASETHEILRRVGYDGHYYLIVPDHAAGRRRRFAVYKIPSSPARRTLIIGRDLTLAQARRTAGQTTESRTVPKKAEDPAAVFESKTCRHGKLWMDYCDYC